MERTHKTDVAIIGGGISGLHVAWRLTDPEYRIAGRKRSVTVFEATDHLGGRLMSIDVPGVHFPIELGAMRFLKSHRLLNGLIDKLGVKIEEMGMPPAQYFLRGRRDNLLKGRRRKTFNWLARTAYLLEGEEAEAASSPDDLIAFGIHRALRRFEYPLLDDGGRRKIVRQVRRNSANPKLLNNLDWGVIVSQGYLQLGPKAVPLWGVGFWNLLAHVLSNQAVRLLEDSFGYHSIIGNWNSAVALPWFAKEFAGLEYYVPVEGFSNLVKRLAERIHQNGGEVRTNSRLLGISRTTGKRGYNWELKFGKGQTGTTCLARHLVLALPRVALERLNIQASGWQYITEDLLPAVKPHNLLKIHLVYEKPWWTRKSFLGADSGKVITDQPLRQIYYYGPEWIEKRTPRQLKKNQTSTWPFIMASYCDSYYTEFWSTFFSRFWRREQGDPYFHETTNWQVLNAKTKAELRNVRDREGVHWRMVNKIHRQLAELHDVRPAALPKPILGLFMNWDWEPYNGGWHTWEVSGGFPPWQAAYLMLEPVPGLYVCGEAYSNEQGWIEGALNTAEELLCKKFRLAPPLWLKPDGT